MKKYYPYIAALLAFLIFLPIIASADSTWTGLVPCATSATSNTPCDFNAFATLINNIITWFLGISASVAAIVFAYGGAQILFHPGDEKKLEEGKSMIWKTVLGMLIILGAWIVVYTVINALVNPATGALRYLQSN